MFKHSLSPLVAMQRFIGGRLGAAAGAMAIGLVGVSCGSSSGPTPVPNPSTPAISGLTASFSTAGCIRSADGLAGRALIIAFNYTDAAGDATPGRVQLTRLYNTGRSETHFFAVPSEVTVTGTSTSGQVRIGNACPLYNDATSSTETLTLLDAAGLASNSLSTTVVRPAGAP
jgi:hypothetical protein